MTVSTERVVAQMLFIEQMREEFAHDIEREDILGQTNCWQVANDRTRRQKLHQLCIAKLISRQFNYTIYGTVCPCFTACFVPPICTID